MANTAASPVLLNASLMCANPLELASDLEALESAGIDLLHCDVMDGTFVPNITMGFDEIEAICNRSSVPVDVHLMVEQPERHLDRLLAARPAYLTMHPESTERIEESVDRVREAGIGVGISLSPRTPVASVGHLLSRVDLVQVMTVEPGFAGQRFIDSTLEKVREVRERLKRLAHGALVQVDGNINASTIPPAVVAGARSLVLGSSSIFAGGTEEFAIRASEIRKIASSALASTSGRMG